MFTSWLFSIIILQPNLGHADLSLRAELENKVSLFLMKKNPKGSDLEGLTQEIVGISNKAKVATVSDRLYADLMIESLELVPSKDFSKGNCKKYRTNVLVQMEPTSSVEPSHPALKETFKILEKLCK